MRAILERSALARNTVVAIATACVLGLAHAALAENDLGLRFASDQPILPSATVEPVEPAPVLTVKRRRTRRAWATLRASRLKRHRGLLAAHGPRGPVARHSAGVRKPSVARLAGDPKLIYLPPPKKPALVSIYEDRTLRGGDAVMLDDGLHVFRGTGPGPFRPRDFVRLTFAAGLDLHLRQTLNAFDHNPPTRWSSLDSDHG